MVVLSVPGGFPGGTVTRIVPDSRGFVWFPHGEGLTRYDGNAFRTFIKADGLPANRVSDIVERPDGTYWIAAQDHLCLFDPGAGRQRFRCESPKLGEIHALLEDNGSLWCGTERGLWRRKAGGSWGPVPSLKPSALTRSIGVRKLMPDSRGDVWAGSYAGLYRFRRDGQVDRWTRAEGLLDEYITIVGETPAAVWAGNQKELLRFQIEAGAGNARIAARYGRSEGLPSPYVFDIRFWQGSVWAATFQGLARLLPSGRWQPVELDQAIRGLPVDSLAIDSQNALWLRTDGGGAARLSGSGFSRFTESDGLPIRKVWAILEDRKGDLNVVTKDEEQYAVNRFDGVRFHSIRPASPFGSMWGWSWSQIAVHSQSGAWWLATRRGLLRYDRGLQSMPSRVGPEDGLRIGAVARVFEERNGGLWASIYEITTNGLFRRDPNTGRFRRFDESDGLPSLHDPNDAVACFAEDRHGQVWMGLLDGGLLRYRNGRFEQFAGRVPGAPEQGARALLVDRRGWLWIGTTGKGLLRIENPSAENPVFTGYDRSSGLSMNTVIALTEDMRGRIYAAGEGAVDRLDPEAPPGSQPARFTTADGLISGDIRVAYRDRHGALWFGGNQGLSRIVPHDDPSPEPAVLIHSIRVNGQSRPISDLGESEPASLSLAASERQLQVEFGGFRRDLRYQTRLSGVDRDWSTPSSGRNVHFSSLAPGSYELLIRAVSPDGAVGAKPARVHMSIAAPIWQRWWFIALIATALIGAAYWMHRFVLERRLAIERTRSRIATDLHDDIGSSLARISVLSDVLRSGGAGAHDPSPVIDQIATSARDLIEQMNDIVWAIDPRQDTLSDVVARIRRFASDVLDAKAIRWSFEARSVPEGLHLSLEERRHLLLIFKEAIHNVVRHSRCETAELRIETDGATLRASIRDDGAGLPGGSLGGRGLSNMRGRAAQLGGSLEVISAPGSGTEVSLRIPLSGAC